MTDSNNKLIIDPVLSYVTKISTLRQPKWIALPVSISPVVSLASTTTATWQVPPSTVFSLGESMLEFTYTSAANAGDYTFAHTEFPPIQGISLISENGSVLYQCDRTLELMKLVQPACTRMSKFLEKGDVTEGGASGLMRVNEVAATGVGAAAIAAGVGSTVASKEITATGGFVDNLYSFQGVRHFRSSGADGTAIATAWSLKGKDLLFSGLADSRLQFHAGKYLTIQITFAASNRLDWLADDNANASRKVAVTAGAITGLKYLLCTEADEATRQSVMAQVMGSGLSYMVPHVAAFDQAVDESANQNRQVVLNGSIGKSLLACFSAVAMRDDQKGLTVCINDDAGTRLWLSKRFSLNNVPLTNESQTPSVYYRQHKSAFAGSLINSAAAHQRHLLWAEDFSGMGLVELAECNANVNGGLDLLSGPLSIGVEYQKPGGNAADVRHHWLFALVNRFYSMTPAGPVVSNVPLA